MVCVTTEHSVSVMPKEKKIRREVYSLQEARLSHSGPGLMGLKLPPAGGAEHDVMK